MGHYRDFVIVELARSEAELIERVSSLEADVEAYRALAVEAIHALHHLARERHRLRAAHHRLLDEYRHLRAQTMSAAVAA